MGELDGMLNEILSSPEDMEKIMGLARELSGGTKPKDAPKSQQPGLDPKLISMLTRLMTDAGGDDEKTALADALKPYVRPEHRQDLDRAVRLVKLMRLAQTAITEYGGELGGII